VGQKVFRGDWMGATYAACQIICIRKQQHTNHMEDDIKRILQDKQFHLQLKSEQKEIIQNVLKEKIQWQQCYPQASDRACVTFSPLSFWTR
jgi:ubiquitin